MTALTAITGLIPLALGAGETGKEILHPLAIVVIGGFIDSTLTDRVVTSAAFKLFGKRAGQPTAGSKASPLDEPWNDDRLAPEKSSHPPS